MSLAALVEAKREYDEYKKFNKLEFYQPYDFQVAFHNAEAGQVYETGNFDTHQRLLARIRGLMAGNQVGKTLSAAREVAMHLTGLYPKWWQGHRFNHPVKWTVCGVINDKTRDICQGELFGEPGINEQFGTGAIPKALIIGDPERKPGVPKAYDTAQIRHSSGGISKLFFGSYNQDVQSLMGTRMDGIWGDEEPPKEVHSQFLRATLSTRGIIMYSFTPENGQTELVYEFLEEMKPNMALIHATWDDAPHFDDPAYREEAEQQFPVHEREMRRQGIPKMGSGMVFPVLDEDLMISPFDLPRHWPRLCAVDFGSDHPFAGVWSAWDRDSDIVYIYDCFKQSRANIATNASSIKKRGQWIPCVWPHDMNQEDPRSSKTYSKLFALEGVNMRPEHFTNPPAPGEKKGDIGVEAGIQHLQDRMDTGRLKVFSNLDDWFTEFRGYHRKDGKIVKLRDDIMSATRYNVMSLRFAYTQPVMQKQTPVASGARNW